MPRRALQHHLARRLASEGRSNAVLCAALLTARAGSGLDLDEFAARVGLEPAQLLALEQGRADPHLVPPALPLLAPDLDWSSLPPAAPRLVVADPMVLDAVDPDTVAGVEADATPDATPAAATIRPDLPGHDEEAGSRRRHPAARAPRVIRLPEGPPRPIRP